jgi:hypothetical protein
MRTDLRQVETGVRLLEGFLSEDPLFCLNELSADAIVRMKSYLFDLKAHMESIQDALQDAIQVFDSLLLYLGHPAKSLEPEQLFG